MEVHDQRTIPAARETRLVPSMDFEIVDRGFAAITEPFTKASFLERRDVVIIAPNGSFGRVVLEKIPAEIPFMEFNAAIVRWRRNILNREGRVILDRSDPWDMVKALAVLSHLFDGQRSTESGRLSTTGDNILSVHLDTDMVVDMVARRSEDMSAPIWEWMVRNIRPPEYYMQGDQNIVPT